jgi:hypothetical protein
MSTHEDVSNEQVLEKRCRHGTRYPHRCRDCESECTCEPCPRCHGSGCVMCDGNGIADGAMPCAACRAERARS